MRMRFRCANALEVLHICELSHLRSGTAEVNMCLAICMSSMQMACLLRYEIFLIRVPMYARNTAKGATWQLWL